MIKYKRGDLFEATENILAHGCNCVGGFGSGVAGIMARKYPQAKLAYLEHHIGYGWKLGEVVFVELPGNRVIANCATQLEYYPRDKVHADYPAIKEAMETVKQYAMLANYSIAIPKIGAGLAGGDWDVIEGILKEVFTDYDVTVYVI